MNYTPEMEKAMNQAHNMNYAEYESKLSNQLKVEQRREEEYQACKHMVAEFDSQLQR